MKLGNVQKKIIYRYRWFLLENILKTTQNGKTQVAPLYKKMALGVFSDVNIVALQ